MLTQHRPKQLGPDPLDVAGWSLDEDFPVFPIGSKPKRLLVCPSYNIEPFLIPGHKYLFKVATGWQAQQMWSEIFAYEIARPLGLAVPACFAAQDSRTKETGVLIEFFYGYPDDQKPPQFVHGSDLLQRILPSGQFQKKIGRPHSYRMNLALCRALSVPDATAWWAGAFGFDALIGNTDRHPENWGLLVQRSGSNVAFEIAPVFDNGTSLGYELTDARISRPWPSERLSQYLARGRHHCSLSETDERGGGHIDLCVQLKRTFPTTGAALRNVVQLADSDVENAARLCAGFNCSVRFSEERAAFVCDLVKARRDQLAHAMGE